MDRATLAAVESEADGSEGGAILFHFFFFFPFQLLINNATQVFTSTILQQVFIVEYVVHVQQCIQCVRLETDHSWTALVQLRQKVCGLAVTDSTVAVVYTTGEYSCS